MERMRDELGRARRRGAHVLMPEEVTSPMDLNPTLGVSAAIIADCAREADQYRLLTHRPADDGILDAGMRLAADGPAARKAQRDTA